MKNSTHKETLLFKGVTIALIFSYSDAFFLQCLTSKIYVRKIVKPSKQSLRDIKLWDPSGSL
jgi:hypothetical protein